MKKIAIISGCALIAFVLVVSGFVIYKRLNQEKLGIRDRTDNINVMLTRAENWKKVAESAVIDVDEMRMIDGSTATIPITAELLRQFYDYTDDQVNQSGYVHHSTTHSAYENLIDRNYDVDLIFVTPPSDEEKQYAKDKNVELDIVPVAKDGFVFITHKDNPVDTLTVAQIQDIYSGKITNWKDVGGNDAEIKAYQREPNSGSQTAMEQMVMQGKEMLSPIEAKVVVGMGMLVDGIAEYENGPVSIGYTYYYYINNLYKNDNIKVIKIDGIEPSNENLISGSYPFSTNYYAVMRKDETEDSPARKLRDYLLTPEGQNLIAMAGYCKAVQ